MHAQLANQNRFRRWQARTGITCGAQRTCPTYTVPCSPERDTLAAVMKLPLKLSNVVKSTLGQTKVLCVDLRRTLALFPSVSCDNIVEQFVHCKS